MKRVFLLLVLILFFLAALPASAQSEVRLSASQVQLWPEYDRPAMLVIYTLQLADDVTLPAEVSVRIPASVGEPTALAVADGTGLVMREYERTVDGDWATISLLADFPVVQLEYYDFDFSQSDNPRTYTYVWPGDYAVDNFTIKVQQPVNASSMILEPALDAPVQGSDGLNYYSADLGSLDAGEEFSLSLSYTKGDTALSAEGLFTDPSSQQPAAQPTAASPGSMPVWAWVLIGVGTAFVLSGVVYFVRTIMTSGRTSSYRNKKKRTASRGSRSSGKQTFCHKCGQRASPDDKFCRECGTKLRV